MAPVSIIHRLQSHELGLRGSYYRSSLQVLRTLVKDPDSHFEQVWYAESKKPIYYEDHKIFANQFRTVFGLWGVNGKPMIQFRDPEKVSVEEVIIHTQKANRLPVPADLFAPLFIKLTQSNRIYRYNGTTGRKLDTIFLGSLFKFVHMSWQVTGESLLLQSVYFKKNNFHDPDILQAVAFIGINPFRFKGMLELTTQMLGPDVKNANVGEDILIVGYGSKHVVQLYSMRDILSDKHSDHLCSCDFGQICHLSHGPVGEDGFGLPVTFKVRNMPPVLFSVQTPDHSVEFGGFPMHFMHKMPKKQSKVRVVDLMTRELVHELDVRKDATDSDRCLFHYDDSGRILFSQADSLKVLKLYQYDKCEVKASGSNKLPVLVDENESETATGLMEQFELRPQPAPVLIKQENVSPNRRTDRPRRATAQKKDYGAAFQAMRPLFAIDHENETEFLSILGVAQQDQSSSICIFDNLDGSFVKRIGLPDLQEDDEYKLVVDLDHVILIAKEQKRHRISVFQLKRGDVVSSIRHFPDVKVEKRMQVVDVDVICSQETGGPRTRRRQRN